MSREKKEEKVKQLEEMLSQNASIVFSDYRGMSVAEITQLRRKLAERGIQYHVVKNTLLGLAAERRGKKGLEIFLQGPTAVAYGAAEDVEMAKALVEYISSARTVLSIKGALLGELVLRPEEVAALAKLPPRGELIARVVWRIKAPLTRLSFVLSADLRNLLMVLQARKQQLEKLEKV